MARGAESEKALRGRGLVEALSGQVGRKRGS